MNRRELFLHIERRGVSRLMARANKEKKKMNKNSVTTDINLSSRHPGIDKRGCIWMEVNIGKWAGKEKTLPQVLIADPDWFFWAISNGVFKGVLADQAEMLARRAKAIKLPVSNGQARCVQHWITIDGEYSHFKLINSDQPPHHGSSTESRCETLDLQTPRLISKYDKLGCKQMMKSFKSHWFGGSAFTKYKVESFFDDPANFVNP